MTTTPRSLNVPFSRPATPGPHGLNVGWYGVGAMGYHMVRNLANHRPRGSPPVLVYNRSASKAENLLKELGPEKIRVASSPDELVLTSDVVFTSLGNDQAVKDVYAGFAKALTASPPTKHKILCDTSTIYPSVAGEVDTLISAIPNTHFVTCPVFGAPPVAIGGQLLVVLSGDYRSKKEVAHLLVPGVGRKALDLGGNVEKAPTFKLLGNTLILGTMELLAEAFTLSEKAGIGSSQLYDFVKEMFPSPTWILYGGKMRDDQFDGTKGFALEGGLKDANHMRRLVTELNSPMPTLDAAHQHLLTARALHAAQVTRGEQTFDPLDWSSLIAGARVAAGLEPFDSASSSKVQKD